MRRSNVQCETKSGIMILVEVEEEETEIEDIFEERPTEEMKVFWLCSSGEMIAEEEKEIQYQCREWAFKHCDNLIPVSF